MDTTGAAILWYDLRGLQLFRAFLQHNRDQNTCTAGEGWVIGTLVNRRNVGMCCCDLTKEVTRRIACWKREARRLQRGLSPTEKVELDIMVLWASWTSDEAYIQLAHEFGHSLPHLGDASQAQTQLPTVMKNPLAPATIETPSQEQQPESRIQITVRLEAENRELQQKLDMTTEQLKVAHADNADMRKRLEKLEAQMAARPIFTVRVPIAPIKEVQCGLFHGQR